MTRKKDEQGHAKLMELIAKELRGVISAFSLARSIVDWRFASALPSFPFRQFRFFRG
jgi:hypothetical protein